MSEMVESMKEGVDRIMEYFYGQNFYRNGANLDKDQLRYTGMPSPNNRNESDTEAFYKNYLRENCKFYLEFTETINFPGSFRRQFLEYMNH